MAKLKNFINNIALLAGVKEDNEQFKTAVEALSGADVDIPDNLILEISKGLAPRDPDSGAYLTLEAAKNNELVKKHFYAKFAIQNAEFMQSVLIEHGVPEDEAKKMAHDKDVPLIVRQKQMLDKITESVYEKAGKSGKAGKDAEEQLSRLNAELKEAIKAKEEAVLNERNSWVNKLKNKTLDSVLSEFDFRKNIPKNAALITAKALLDEELKKAGFVVGFDPESASIRLQTESGMTAYENNSPADFKAFASRVIADNKLLSVAAPSEGQQNQKPANGWNPAPMPQQAPTNGKPAPDLSSIAEANLRAAEQF